MNIYTDVVCDLFHSGHVSFFKTINNIYPNCNLIVGLMSDDECKNYKRKPIYNIEERYMILSSIKYVKKVIKNAPMPITENFIKEQNIDLIIHGDDISKESENYWYKIPILMNIYKTVPYTESISSSKIIEKIKLNY
tara:strand:+ start:3889 stop:4299 length:411 start_codon:yes stop_codon:yes gene_type:complete